MMHFRSAPASRSVASACARPPGLSSMVAAHTSTRSTRRSIIALHPLNCAIREIWVTTRPTASRRRPISTIGVAGANDAPARRPFAEQVALAHLLAPDAVNPGQHIGGFQHLDRLIDRIAAAFGLFGYRLVAREAKAGLAVVKAKQHRLEHLHIGAGDRAAMLALLSVAGVVTLHKGFEPRLGIAVERDATGGAEHLLAAGPQVIRQS